MVIMNIFLTGEEGFIANNLKSLGYEKYRDVNFVNDSIRSECKVNKKGEIDFVKTDINILELLLSLSHMKCDIIIHNGAAVGTDVCALNAKNAIINNVYGTFNIAQVAKKLNIPILYIGTTVIYDTQKVQNGWIDEYSSPIFPRTLYATTKYEGELIIKAYCEKSRYSILRPLFCYGGIGDMNSLIAKTVYNHLSGRKSKFKIFLDQTKIKDYMHVNDFCEAIFHTINNEKILKSNHEFNISADNPIITSKIVEKMQDRGIDTSHIVWVPETDYLGNHRVDNSKFKIATRNKWSPTIDIDEGIDLVINDQSLMIQNSYNPFVYLDQIEKESFDVESHYNFGK